MKEAYKVFTEEELETAKGLSLINHQSESTDIGFMHNGTWITTPFMEETGRFEFKDYEGMCDYYGKENVENFIDKILGKRKVDISKKTLCLEDYISEVGYVISNPFEVEGFEVIAFRVKNGDYDTLKDMIIKSDKIPEQGKKNLMEDWPYVTTKLYRNGGYFFDI